MEFFKENFSSSFWIVAQVKLFDIAEKIHIRDVLAEEAKTTSRKENRSFWCVEVIFSVVVFKKTRNTSRRVLVGIEPESL